MKTILVPIDFSDVSENAAHYAADLAKYSDARLVLLNTYSLPMPLFETPIAEMQFDEIDKINKEQLESLRAKLKASHGNIAIECASAIGFTVEETLLYAEDKKADLIVAGISGADKSSTIIGSSTSTIIKESLRPVLTIPEGVRFKKPERIALACDYNSIVPADVVDKFIGIVKLFNAKVLVFDVLKKAELVTYEKALAEENLEEALYDIEHTLHFPSGDNLIEEINAFVDKHVVDMLVMIPHKYNFFTGLFHHSNSKQMALNTSVPLLTIHE
jgi:nucleotide-binding universal stress UspA family protein